jgi:hypothetical protein
MLKIGREGRGLRTQVPLQPLADGVADRSAGLAVDLFTVVVCSAIHEAALRLFQRDDHNKSRRPKLFRRFPVKIAKRQRTVPAVESTKGPEPIPAWAF